MDRLVGVGRATYNMYSTAVLLSSNYPRPLFLFYLIFYFLSFSIANCQDGFE